MPASSGSGLCSCVRLELGTVVKCYGACVPYHADSGESDSILQAGTLIFLLCFLSGQ